MWQRRRNEMRLGFERLRDALPPTTQRLSKSLILDSGEYEQSVACEASEDNKYHSCISRSKTYSEHVMWRRDKKHH